MCFIHSEPAPGWCGQRVVGLWAYWLGSAACTSPSVGRLCISTTLVFLSSFVCDDQSVRRILISSEPANADKSTHLISKVESVDWGKVPIANSRHPKEWRRLASHSPGRVERAGNFVKYDSQTRRVFVTKIFPVWGIEMSARTWSLCLNSTCFSEKIQEVSAIPTSNTLARVSAR